MTKLPIQKRYYPLWWLLQGIAQLPFSILYFISDGLFFVLYFLVGYRKKVVFQNLQNAFPDKTKAEQRAIAQQFYRNLTDIILETIKLAAITPENLKERVKILNPEVIEAATTHGELVLALGGHQGNWEWAPSGGIFYLNCPIDVVYKPLSNSFFEFLSGGPERA
ncbi:lysophospholipid acyltransferase family protein [Adhaeribacter pallidiroseus]|uniref:Kdo(2)-lipid IV(A) lauroyltransferase n=1 Tax=Adhaeribacter pallidiroseus TaxID=2072847 RepID=A0A369QFR5_9BACT|nr:hypothetical protein [Adhaeribacter pallidiroseus]RDC62395.1 Kdo(2)-lipid IV(A) lauroyltransferase [Adhaeribacter pallidiroseus]